MRPELSGFGSSRCSPRLVLSLDEPAGRRIVRRVSLRRVLVALYVATACGLALVTYVPDEARFLPLYALLLLELPLSLLVAIVLWAVAYGVNIVAPDLAPAVVPAVAVTFWTLGALGNAFLVGWLVRAVRGPAQEAEPEPPADPEPAEPPVEPADAVSEQPGP